MKETPILFTKENVPKILDGSKTMTRRVIKGVPKCADAVGWDVFSASKGKDWVAARGPYGDHNRGEWFIHCPYGGVGDRLWVREKHMLFTPITTKYIIVDYPSGYKTASDMSATRHVDNPEHLCYFPKWRSPLFMPKWAARIWLEITSLRVERLQEISHDDVIAEGCSNAVNNPLFFPTLWDSINGKKYPWGSNPWVWVIGFEVIK
jgi:hypothetical protein